MHLELFTRSLADHCGALEGLSRGLTRVWPDEQPLMPVADPRIVGTRFLDVDLIAPPAVAQLLAEAATVGGSFPGLGGKKIRSDATWSCPELRLLSLRAMLLVCRAVGAAEAHVVDRWANVMVQGDYSTPHSHYESEFAVVHALDPGDIDPRNPTEGRLGIIDSRIPYCCSSRPERPTRAIIPLMSAGTMLVFPAEFIHHVPVYHGRRPRITLAWNISTGPPPAHGVRDFTKDMTAQIGVKMGLG